MRGTAGGEEAPASGDAQVVGVTDRWTRIPSSGVASRQAARCAAYCVSGPGKTALRAATVVRAPSLLP